MRLKCNLFFLSIFILSACLKGSEDKYNEKWIIKDARKQVLNVRNTSKGIPIEDIREMKCGKEGFIWFRGGNDKLCSWKDEEWRIYDFKCKKIRLSYGKVLLINYDNIRTLRKGKIENIDFEYKQWGGIADAAVDREGKIWAIFTRGILIYDGKTFNPIPFPERFLTQDLSIAVSEDNEVFICNYMGLFRMDGKKLLKVVTPEIFESANMLSLFTSSKGIVWGNVRRKNQYFVFSYNNGEFKFWEKERKTEGFIEDFKGTIYTSNFISTYYPTFLGFEYFDGTNWKKINLYGLDSLLMKKIKLEELSWFDRNEAVLQDKNGDYWVLGGELLRYSGDLNKFEIVRPEEGLISDKINGISYLDKKWFIATPKGLSVYDGKTWRSFFLGEIYDMTFTKEGSVYALGKEKIFIMGDKIVDTLELPLQTRDWSKLALNNKDFLLSKDTLLLASFNDCWIRDNSLEGKVVGISKADRGFWVAEEDNVFNFSDKGKKMMENWGSYLPGKINCLSAFSRNGFLLGTSTGIYSYREDSAENLLGKELGDILNLREGVFNDIWIISEKSPHLNRLELLEEKVYPIDEKVSKNVFFDVDDNGDILAGKDGLIFFDFDYECVKKEKIVQERKSWRNPLQPFLSVIRKKISNKFKECDLKPPLKVKIHKNLNRKLRIPPAASEDNLFFLDEDGYLIKFDFFKEEFSWKVPLKDEKIFKEVKYHNDRVYLLGFNLLVFDSNNGDILYEMPFYAEDIIIKDNILFVLCKNLIRIIELSENRWDEVGRINLHTINNRIFTGGESMLYVFSKNSQQVFTEDNKLIWENKRLYNNKIKPIFFKDCIVYSKLDTLIAIDGKTGNIRWKFETGSDIVSNIEVAGNRVLFGDSSGCVSCLIEGEEKWRIVLPENTLGKENFKFYLRVSKDFLYVVMSSGKIFSYDLKNGELSWGYYEIHSLSFQPVLKCNKIILIKKKGVLYVLGN